MATIQSIAQTDATLLEIVSPTPGADCNGGTSITPEFIVSNSGTTPITLLFYTIQIDDEDPVQSLWTGLLNLQGAVTIISETLELDNGPHTVTITIGNVNGLPDGNTTNNELSVDFEIINGSGLTVELLTDDYGGETFFSITDEDGNIIAEEEGFDNNTLYTFDYCVGEGCYDFFILDTSGDGICCEFGDGYYRVIDGFGQILAEGGDFGNNEEEEVCVEIIELEPLDAAITEVAPSGDLCTSSFIPTVVIRNEGEDDFTEVTFAYELNGVTLGEFTWTGLLSTFESEEIALPLIENLVGENILTVIIISVNGITDDFPDNDSASVAINVIGESGFTIFLETGGGPPFNVPGYLLTDSGGNIIDEIEELETDEEYELTYCLPEDCYIVTVTDPFGAGRVDFEVIADAGYTLAISQDFTNELITSFCSSPPLQNDAAVLSSTFPEAAAAICGNSLAPEVVVSNAGIDNLTSIDWEYAIGDQTETFTWTGNLGQFEQATVVFPELTGFDFGAQTFSAIIININGVTDENIDNNIVSSDFEFTDGDGIVLTIETGNAFTFIGLSFEVLDPVGNVLAEQNGFNEETVYTFPICSSPGCFTLLFESTFGNGELDVTYEITDADDNTILSGAGVPGGGSVEESYCTPNADIPDYDVQLVEIISPTNTPICGSSFSLSFEAVNLGGENITEMEIEYFLEGEATNTYTWAGNIALFGSVEIELPALDNPGPGNYDFTINIVSINGEMDEDDSNNTASTDLTFTLAQSVLVELTLDDFGFFDYDLMDEDGNTIIQNEFVDSDVSETLCLEVGCYTLSITDFFGNGIDFSIVNDIGMVLAENEPFTNFIEVDFCVTPIDLEEVDAAVNQITSPSPVLCNATVTPAFSFLNNGLNAVTEIEYEYIYDDNIEFTETWTGNITTFQTAEIELSPLGGFAVGAHNLTINILTVNGQTDLEAGNNSLTQNFTITNADNLTLNIQTDFLPMETSFDITDAAGTILFAGDDFNSSSDNLVDLCLETGCYTLTIYDEFGDGGPSYSIVNGNNEILVEGDYGFGIGNSLSVDFCTEENAELLPVAAFQSSIGSAVSTCGPLTVSFTDASVNATAWSWSLPGSDMETSTEQNPMATYNTPGTYDIGLTVTNETGTDDLVLAGVVTILPDPYFVLVQGENNVEVTYSGLEEPVSIEWSDGSSDPIFEYTDPSVVSVTVTDGNGCSSTQEIDLASGISTLPATANIALYPNPANDQLFLSHTLPNGYTFNIKDLLGRTIYTQTIDSDLVKIDLTDKMTNGLYLVEISNGVEMGVYKVLVIR